jgi:hypothetical protein
MSASSSTVEIVVVETLSGRSLTFDSRYVLFTTLNKFKVEIQQMTGVPVAKQQLLLDGKILDGDGRCSLADLGISVGSVLQLVAIIDDDDDWMMILDSVGCCEAKPCVLCGLDNPNWRAVPACRPCTLEQARLLDQVLDQVEEARRQNKGKGKMSLPES